MSDTVIAPDLRERHEQLSKQLRGSKAQQRYAQFTHELIERVSKAEQENVALRAERRTILDSVTRHCTPEQINAITADTLAARGREGE